MQEPRNKFLDDIQNAPHHVKKRYVVWGTVVVMLALLIIWLANIRTFLRLDPPRSATRSETTNTSE